MKRILAVLTLVCFVTSSAFAYYPDAVSPYRPSPKGKMILGFVLGIAGALIAVDGFSQVENDLSRPGVSVSLGGFSPYTDTRYPFDWWLADANGTVENTGNVPIDSVEISVTYYDARDMVLPAEVPGVFTPFDGLEPGQRTDWGLTGTVLGADEPVRAEVSASYTWVRKVEKKLKNPTQGAAGVLCTLVGAYLVISSLSEVSYLSDMMERHDVDVRVVSNPGMLGMLVAKRI